MDSTNSQDSTVTAGGHQQDLQLNEDTQSGQAKHLRQNSPRKSRFQPKRGVPAEVKQEADLEISETMKLQPLRKRKSTAQQMDHSPQELGDDSERGEMPVRKKARPPKKQALKGTVKPPPNNEHVILMDEEDSFLFFYMTQYRDNNLRAIRVLEIHLDATKLDDPAEYRLAVALKEFHPHADGTNPHNLQAIRIVVKGNLLFTRYSYHLTSPALSQDINENMKKLIAGGLSEQEKARLPYKLNSTEKGIAKALLGIRGVKQVIIEGKGKMEGDFAETLKATLVQPPGADIAESEDPTLPNSNFQLNGVGEIESEAYGPKASRPYPTRTSTSRHDFSSLIKTTRYVMDEKAQLLAHFVSPVDDVHLSSTFSVSSRPTRRHLREVDVSTTAKTHGTNTRKQGHDQDHALGLEHMIRIKAREEPVGKRGLDEPLLTIHLPLVLTGKGGNVELGWKA